MKNRPIGISILAVLYILGGVAILGLQIGTSGALQEAFKEMGIATILGTLSLTFLGVLGVAAGIGMWRGKVWGWWLGAFYLTYSVARSANALFLMPMIAEQYNVAPTELTK